MFICRQCGAVVPGPQLDERPHRAMMPEDWSFIQLGTTGEYRGHAFRVVGRIRMQLRNAYQNFWCAEYNHGMHVWLADAMGSIAVLMPPWKEYQGSEQKLRAGELIKLSQQMALTGEYVEKCERVACVGELGDWRYWLAGTFVVQASMNNGLTAFFFIRAKYKSWYLAGEKVPLEKLKLQSIKTWHEWK